MRSCVWTTLLRRIPAEHHNILMLVTRCGTEIALQNVLYLDEEVLAIRGRLAGSQDAGRLYFVPLDSIDYFGFNRMVKDEEFNAMFGNLEMPPVVAAPVVAAPPVAAAPEPPAPQEIATIEEPEPPSQPGRTPSPTAPLRPTLPIKSAVLERFRSRGPGPINGSGT